MGMLAWIGRQRTRAVAALVFIGIALPPLGALLKPYVTEAVIGVLCISFLRVDVAALRTYLRTSWVVVAATVWTTFAIPLIFALVCKFSGLDAAYPTLFLGLMLQAVTSPMMAAPAFAALMGLDATLVLVTLIASSMLTPISAPLFAAIAGLELSLSPMALGLKLLGILAGSAVIGLLLRRFLGAAVIEKRRDEIDGINILILFVFIAAVMADVGVWFLEKPMLMLGLTAIAFVVYFLLLGITYVAFLKAGSKRAFAVGMMTSQRNMGLMLAATGGVLPDITWLYIAVGQFPIYLSPQILQPIARRINQT